MPEPKPIPSLQTGIPEMDLILRGGLPKHRLHLIEGAPGTGKTTFALRFLLEGVRKGEKCLYVTLSESTEELATSAETHGWSLDGIDVFEFVPAEAELENQQTVLYPAEAEFGDTMRRITDRIETTSPERVVIDSLAELRLLAQEPLPYRRQLLALKRALQGRHVTTLVLDDLTSPQDEDDLHSLVHGVISLEQIERDYGASRRRLRVAKMRGSRYQSGWHDFTLVTGNVLVFPSLIAEEHQAHVDGDAIRSGIQGLDDLLGGLDRGTTTMLVGPSGVGKSSMAVRYATAAVSRGEHVAYFSFDEDLGTLSNRAEALGMPVGEAKTSGLFCWHRASPSRISPGEFMWQVRREVEEKQAKLVVIDSLNSYLAAMPEERSLLLQMHELLTYLNNRGIVTILILAQPGVVGDLHSAIDLSFLSDTLVLLRFFEVAGELRKAVSVIKKRTGVHELAIREFHLFPDGMQVGPPLLQLHGVMTGVPTYTGSQENLIGGADDAQSG